VYNAICRVIGIRITRVPIWLASFDSENKGVMARARLAKARLNKKIAKKKGRS